MAKKAKAKEVAKKTIEQTLWDSANELRGNLDAAEYKSVVLGLVFLKYINDCFKVKHDELVAEGDGFEEDPDEYIGDNIFFVPTDARWDKVVKASLTAEIGVVVDGAMEALEKENKQLKGILPKNYARPELDKRRLGNVIDIFENNLHFTGSEARDVLGRVYEYFLGEFAREEGKKGGEFYTPSCVVRTIVEVIQPYKGKIFDPACGSGGMFVQSMKFVERHHGNRRKVSVYGQEYTKTTFKLAKMNLAIRGIAADLGDYAANTFTDDRHKDLKADFIMANPPFNQKDWRADNQLTDDPRWDGYDVPPTSNANYAWILNMVSKLSSNGVAGFILANGALSADGTEGEIRRKMIERGLVEAIVILPRNLFYSTDISVTLWIINANKKGRLVNRNGEDIHYRDREKEILFIDMRQMGEPFEKKYVRFTDEDIRKVADTYHNWQREGHTETYTDIPEFCKSVSVGEDGGIADKGFSLVPSKYIEFVNRDESVDYDTRMKELQSELADILRQEAKSRESVLNVFKSLGYEIEL